MRCSSERFLGNHLLNEDLRSTKLLFARFAETIFRADAHRRGDRQANVRAQDDVQQRFHTRTGEIIETEPAIFARRVSDRRDDVTAVVAEPRGEPPARVIQQQVAERRRTEIFDEI